MNGFIRSLRVPFVRVTLAGVFLGTSAAYYRLGEVDLLTTLTVAFIVVTGHISANLFNDYFDQTNDGQNDDFTQFSGGSRVIQDGECSSSDVLRYGILFLLLSIFAGIWFITTNGNIKLLLFGATGLFLGYAYTGPPLKLVYRGLGELTITATFGLFIVGGAYLAQTGNLTATAYLVALPAGLLTANILLVNSHPDKEADMRSGKRTFIVQFGTENMKRLTKSFIIASYASIAFGAMSGHLPYGALIVYTSLPIASSFFESIEHIEEDFLIVGKTAIALQIAFTVTAAIGIIANNVIS